LKTSCSVFLGLGLTPVFHGVAQLPYFRAMTILGESQAKSTLFGAIFGSILLTDKKPAGRAASPHIHACTLP